MRTDWLVRNSKSALGYPAKNIGRNVPGENHRRNVGTELPAQCVNDRNAVQIGTKPKIGNNQIWRPAKLDAWRAAL